MGRQISTIKRVIVGIAAASLVLGVAGCGASLSEPSAEEPASFYAGNDLEIIIPSSTGGGTDAQGRFFAEFLDDYVPGNPNVFVTNVEGTGGVAGGNVFHNRDDHDSTAPLLFSSASYVFPWIFGEPALELDYTEYIERELRPLEGELDPEKDDVPIELRDKVRRRSAELGFYAADFPEDLGGSGLPQLGMVLLREAAARTGCRLAGFTVYGPEGPTGVLLAGTDEQKKKYLTPLITAEKSMCFALTEPDAGSDAQNIKTTAVKDGDSWVINGTKHFITNGKHADFALVFAVTDKELKGSGGITAFIVEASTPGFEVGRGQIGMLEGEGQFELIFRDCRVGEDQILGGPENLGMGFYAAMQFLAMGRLSIAAMCNGIADYCVKLGIDYAKERQAFGRPIGKNQYVQGHIVDSLVELKASKLITYECADKYDRGDAVIQESSIAKLYSTEMVNRVVDRMIQVHGGMGWMRDLPLERIYRLVRIFTLVEGTSEIQKYIIAKSVGL